MKREQLRPPDGRVFKALYALGLGRLVGRVVLLLTTTGRKSGLPRVTALQCEEIEGAIYFGWSKGTRADFLEERLRRHPRMVGAMLKSEGLPAAPSRVNWKRMPAN